MAQHYPETKSPTACYFYLPSFNGKSAEIILVLNSDIPTIQIPVPEEDLELHSFFQRDMTENEIKQFGTTASTWRIFTSWFQLETDHQEYEVNKTTLGQLLKYKYLQPLQDNCIAVA